MGDDNRRWQVLWVVWWSEQAVVADLMGQGGQRLRFA